MLRDLRITKIEWTTLDTICTLRFSFNNGTTSVQLGNRVPIQKEFIVPNDVEIKKIEVAVRGDQEYLEALNFFDEKGVPVLAIRGENVKGTWSTLQLQKDQHIIGIKANMCTKYVRGIIFYIWRLGMGVPG